MANPTDHFSESTNGLRLEIQVLKQQLAEINEKIKPLHKQAIGFQPPPSDQTCPECKSGLGPWKQVGEVEICRNCYDRLVMEMAMDMGVHQALVDRFEMKKQAKKWKEFFDG